MKMLDLPLYPTEEQIAKAVLGPKRAHLWKEIAILDERDGLPKIDAIHGGRYWPAVERFYQRINSLDRGENDGPIEQPGNVVIMDFAPDGQEAPLGAQAKPASHQRRAGRNRRARA